MHLYSNSFKLVKIKAVKFSKTKWTWKDANMNRRCRLKKNLTRLVWNKNSMKLRTVENKSKQLSVKITKR